MIVTRANPHQLSSFTCLFTYWSLATWNHFLFPPQGCAWVVPLSERPSLVILITWITPVIFSGAKKQNSDSIGSLKPEMLRVDLYSWGSQQEPRSFLSSCSTFSEWDLFSSELHSVSDMTTFRGKKGHLFLVKSEETTAKSLLTDFFFVSIARIKTYALTHA